MLGDFNSQAIAHIAWFFDLQTLKALAMASRKKNKKCFCPKIFSTHKYQVQYMQLHRDSNIEGLVSKAYQANSDFQNARPCNKHII